MKRESLFAVSVSLLLLLVAGYSAFAQSTGTITGLVTDSSGSVIPGVSVTVTDVATGIHSASKTESGGLYDITLLPVGTYTLVVEQKGFKQLTLTGIRLDAGQVVEQNVQLQVGDVSQSITINAELPLVDTESASLSTVIDERRVVDLPLNGRSFLSLTQLVAGANPGLPNTTITGDFQGGGEVSVNGQRPSSGNNFTLDGVNDEAIQGRWASVRPSIDAIQEFDMETGQYSAAMAIGTGAQIALVLKSGTNAFHGTLFEFLRNNALDANDFFLNSAGIKRQPFRRNQFGGVASGPIIRNRTFWLFNYEGTRIPAPQTLTGNVPTAQELTGDFSAFSGPIIDPSTGAPFPGNKIPAGRINSASQKLLGFWPAPNANQPGFNYIASGSNNQSFDNYIVKIDHQISSNDKISGHYAWVNRNETRVGLISFFSTTSFDNAKNVGLNYTHTFTPNLLLDLKAGFHRELSGRSFPSRDPAKYSGQALGIPLETNQPNLVGVPLIEITSFAAIGDASFTPYYSADNIFQYEGDAHATRGRHNISFGVVAYREQQNQFVENESRGDFVFDGVYTTPTGGTPAPENGLADFLLGAPNVVNAGSGSIPDYQRSTVWGVYVQDDFKVRHDLTLNLGLRYDLHTMPTDTRGLARNFDPATGEVIGNGTPGEKLVNGDHNNFAPRFGFAWQPFGSTKTVVRGGAGVYYDHVEHNQWTILESNPPTYFASTFTNNITNPLLITDPLSPTLAFPSFFAVDPHIRTGYNDQWTLNVQRQVASNLSVEVGYVGSSAHKLGRWWDANAAQPGPGDVQARRPFQQYTTVYFWAGDANASYNGLLLQVRKRYSHGLTVLSAYTYSKTIDGGSYSTGNGGFGNGQNTVENPFNRNPEKARSAFDVPHRWVTSFIWDLPSPAHNRLLAEAVNGWQFATIASLQSGYPVNIDIANDQANIGCCSQRPNVSGNPNLPSGQQTIAAWFNTSAFSEPAPFTFGNAGRNLIRSDGTVNFDMSVMKVFHITEHHTLQFRSEFFNAFNSVVFSAPGSTLGATSFGVVTGQANTPRQIQFGLKYAF